MPLLQFDVIEGRSESEIKTMLDATHAVVLEAFKVPERDRYQLVRENKRYQMVFQDTGLGFERTDNFVLLRVYTSPRPQEQKLFFIKRLAEELKDKCGIEGTDLMVSFINNETSDWSFAYGEAQYVTGAL